MFLLLLLFRYT